MRVLGRIIYALFMVLLLLFVVSFSQSMIAESYFNKYAPQAISEQQDDFFYGSTGYHTKTPFKVLTSEGFTIKFYEVDKLFVHNKTKDKRVDEYFYILIYDEKNRMVPSNEKHYFLSFLDEKNERYDIFIQRFRNQEIFVAVNVLDTSTDALLDVKAFTDKSLIDISIISEAEGQEETLVTMPFSIKDDTFIVKDILLKYDDNYQEHGVYIKKTHDTSEFQHIMYIALAIYVAILILVTYLLFFVNYHKIMINYQRKKVDRMKKK